MNTIAIIIFIILVINVSGNNFIRVNKFKRNIIIKPFVSLLDTIEQPKETNEKRLLSPYDKNINEEVKDHNQLAYKVKDNGAYQCADRIPQELRYQSSDWIHNLFNIQNSTVLKEIRGVIMVNTLWSIIIYAFHKIIKFSFFGSKSHSLLGSALGLLLVFRTNSSYSRFWEGRIILEKIVNSSRKLSRIFVNYRSIIPAEKIDRVLHLIAAFPVVIEQHLKGCNNDEEKTACFLRKILSQDELERLGAVRNRPLYITTKLSNEIMEIEEKGLFTTRERQTMQSYADELCNALGAAERLVQTPVPLTYARHTSRFLSLYLLSLPVALVAEIGISVIPFTCFATWSLFGILQIGYMIEDPFQLAIKLDYFTETIKDDIKELLFINNYAIINPI